MKRGFDAGCWKWVAWSALAAVCLASPAAAMRYVEFNISVDRKTVLRASTGDRGDEDADTVWRYLKRLPWRSMNGYRVRPDARHPQRATLQGKIDLVPHGYHGVSVDRLRLVRSPGDGKWRLAPGEVERTQKLLKMR